MNCRACNREIGFGMMCDPCYVSLVQTCTFCGAPLIVGNHCGPYCCEEHQEAHKKAMSLSRQPGALPWYEALIRNREDNGTAFGLA